MRLLLSSSLLLFVTVVTALDNNQYHNNVRGAAATAAAPRPLQSTGGLIRYADSGAVAKAKFEQQQQQIKQEQMAKEASKFYDQIVIFLDIDGVLKPGANDGSGQDDDIVDHMVGSVGDHFPDYTMFAFESILEAFPQQELRIVLSSAWRFNRGKDVAIKEFHLFGDHYNEPRLRDIQQFDALTGKRSNGRQSEIYVWLQSHDYHKFAAWIALDDTNLVEGNVNQEHRSIFEGHQIRTDPRVGLNDNDAELAIQLIKQQLNEE